jgi:hypothetical protein
MILLDTNVLARVHNSAHPHCIVARRAVPTPRRNLRTLSK